MRTEQPQTIRLQDYRQPDYLIDETHLTFELFEDHALVHSRLVMRGNAGAAALDSRVRGNDDSNSVILGESRGSGHGAAALDSRVRGNDEPNSVILGESRGSTGGPALVLHGQQLELISVAINDQALSPADYQVDAHSLTLHPQT